MKAARPLALRWCAGPGSIERPTSTRAGLAPSPSDPVTGAFHELAPSLRSETEQAPRLSGIAPRQRLLLLADSFQLAYRVLRCARASGAEVYVLGNPGATALRLSRHCRRFFPSACIIHGQRDPALALEINCLTREHGITLVLPGDAPSTRALIASGDLIQTPCFPLPTLAEFDLLNDKWAFAQLCQRLAIRHPSSTLYADTAALAVAIRTRGLNPPVIAKPLSLSGGVGFVLFDGMDTDERLRAINYQPILVQDFIPGEPIGASVYAHRGRIEAFIAHHYRRRIYTAFPDRQIHTDLEKIVAQGVLTGVYNFDMMLSPDGAVHYLECNPRFFYKINLSMIAGVNFVAHGLCHSIHGAHRPPHSEAIHKRVRVRFPEALLLSMLGDRPTARDWAMAAYLYSDPLPYLLEKLNLTV